MPQPRQFNSIEDVNAFLENIPMFSDRGVKAANFSLDAIRAFCTFIGNPQNSFKSIHVAGTNGKGTVCHMLASVYQEAGYKTGLYTSPHFEKVNERFRANGEQVEDEWLISFFGMYAADILRYKLTFFEITTAFAFWYFKQLEVDIAIIETGLGGRLDATNIIHPELSVITSIGLDHTDVLGDSIAAIATEKAGIIKMDMPLVIGELPEEARTAIQNKANDLNATTYDISGLEPTWDDSIVRFKSPLTESMIEINAGWMNPVQALNAAICAQSVAVLSNIFPVSEEKLISGLSNFEKNTQFGARFERLIPTENWFYDGAHNTEAQKKLVQTIHKNKFKRPFILVFSVMRDKFTKEFQDWVSEFDELYYFSLNNERSATFDEVQKSLPNIREFNPETFFLRYKSVVVIFAGSFYFYAKIKGLIKSNA